MTTTARLPEEMKKDIMSAAQPGCMYSERATASTAQLA